MREISAAATYADGPRKEISPIRHRLAERLTL
jgi:hypothetical protein